MAFFQGSLQPNFISFCLANPNGDDQQSPTNAAENNSIQPRQMLDQILAQGNTRAPVPSPPPFPPKRSLFSQFQNVADSPFSTDSNFDVTSYATEMVQRIEAVQADAQAETRQTDERPPETAGDTRA